MTISCRLSDMNPSTRQPLRVSTPKRCGLTSLGTRAFVDGDSRVGIWGRDPRIWLMFVFGDWLLQLKALQEKLRIGKNTKDAKTETEDMAEDEEVDEGDEGRQQQQQDAGELSFDLEPAARPSEEEIRQEMLSMFPGGTDNFHGEEATVFAITMMCMAEGCELQVGALSGGDTSGGDAVHLVGIHLVGILLVGIRFV